MKVAPTGSLLTRAQAERAVAFSSEQVGRLVTHHPDYFPLYTVQGRWFHEHEAWTNWTEGFLGGLLWIFAERTGERGWRRTAEHYSRLIEQRKEDRTVHDLGFLFWHTYKRWFDLTGDPAKQQVVVDAGRTMSLRFNEAGSYLRSFVAPESCFIDIMMNVGIVFYAGQVSGDERLVDIGHRHCRTTRRHLMRGDGSTAHEGIFDVDTGEFLRQSTHQGWRGDSCWARGHAWALYGFGTAHLLTGEPSYLDSARRCADYYLDHTPAHGIPPNDWDEPHPTRPYESSASAVAAGGLLQLAELTAGDVAAGYRDAGLRILATLCEPPFLAVDDPEWEGILKHGSYHERKGLGVDESVMWGEYFFVEALERALQGPLETES